ncbi:MAG: tetratricopeptide repeat protein [Balneolaceae bacterium]|nr:tetratricopeptide repeat protein [Balneolaceae bacterium]
MEEIEQQMSSIRKELEDSPDDPGLLNELGVGHQLLGEYEEAEKCFLKAIEEDPGEYTAYYNLANTYVEMERVEEAVNRYLDALDRKADFVPALNNLADIYCMAGEDERALELFEYITRLKPKDPTGHFNLGNHLLRMNDTVEAGRAYQQVLELDDAYYEAWNNIGFILKHLGKYEEAIPYYERCLEIKPDYRPALDDIRECRRKVGE